MTARRRLLRRAIFCSVGGILPNGYVVHASPPAPPPNVPAADAFFGIFGMTRG